MNQSAFSHHIHCAGATVCLLLMALLAAFFSSCSDEVLNPDGTVGTPGGPLVLGTEPPTAESGLPSPDTGHLTLSGTDPLENAEHRLYVDFLNTGASDCILVRMDEIVMLIDTADKDDYEAIAACLDGYGITSIDYLIITHFDNDHIGSAARLLADYPVTEMYMPDYVRESNLYRSMMAQLEDEDCRTRVHRMFEADEDIDLGYGRVWINSTAMTGYEPGQSLGADEDNKNNEENNFSLITSVTFGQITLLLTGDAEGERMEEFLPLCVDKGFSTYTLIKVPHHGRSDDKGLLTALGTLMPRYCVVCTGSASDVAGAVNTKMRAIGAGRYYTYDGRITFYTDGSSVWMTQT